MASLKSSVLIQDSFSVRTAKLRRAFERRMGDPRSDGAASHGRFVWDYWHVPNQYQLLRTPADAFFGAEAASKRDWAELQAELVRFGRERLGCHGISPIWLSCYVEGCKQEFHADLPHGPWAFVLSLTPWKRRRFTGGETLLLDDAILSYWENPLPTGLERDGIVRRLPPELNRLTIFDPRIPHGVSEVRGARDPLEGRLVLHGWFTQPRPFIHGPLPKRELEAALGTLDPFLKQVLAAGKLLQGYVALSLAVSASGRPTFARILTSTLQPRHDEAAGAIEGTLLRWAKGLRFSKRQKPSRVTLPLVFGD